jgi:triosephosphate isomerase
MVEEQLRSALVGVNEADLKLVVIAYEPVWAIGTGKNASATEAEEMKLFIHKILADLFPREKSESVRVIYGGSVTPDNVEDLLSVGHVDGFLVGGASLDAKQFVAIIKIADQYARMA